MLKALTQKYTLILDKSKLVDEVTNLLYKFYKLKGKMFLFRLNAIFSDNVCNIFLFHLCRKLFREKYKILHTTVI